MAKLPKKYYISNEVFDLENKHPRIDVKDFLSLSDKVLRKCEHIYLTYQIKKKQLKRLHQFAATHGIAVHDRIEACQGYSPNVVAREKDRSLSLPDVCIIDNTDGELSKELTKVRESALPEREYKVQIVGKPPKVIKEEDDRVFMTPMGPMPASALGLTRKRYSMEVYFPTVWFDGSDNAGPVVQDVYYNRIALANVLEKRLPYQTPIRERNAFKYRICRELTDEEFITLAADTKAQDELVKGLTVKK